MSAPQLRELEQFLRSQGIVCDALDDKGRFAAVAQWTSCFAHAFSQPTQYKEGMKARHALTQVDNGDFLLLSITNELPKSRSSRGGPKWGYACKATVIPDLSEFCDLDFAMVASDYSWTMMYTHEDFAIGGPYFVEKSWPESPPQEKRPVGGHGRKQGRRK